MSASTLAATSPAASGGGQDDFLLSVGSGDSSQSSASGTSPDAPEPPHQWSDVLPLFDITYYLEHNPDVAASGQDPLENFLQSGAFEGRSPNADFDCAYYLSQNQDVAGAGMNPFLHYLAYGWMEGRMASARNDFQALHPEVGSPEVTGRAQALLQDEMQAQHPPADTDSASATHAPTSLVDASFYFATYTDVAQAGLDATEHYMDFGWKEGRDPDAFFDTSYYLALNHDVATAGVNPLEHYLQYGAHEGRDPSAAFSTQAYLEHYTDVATAGMNPLLHYLEWGQAEGREIFPA